MLKHFMQIIVFIVLLSITVNGKGLSFEKPIIFPIPLSIEMTESSLTLDNEAVILVPKERSESNILITELLLAEFGDKFRIPVNVLEAEHKNFNLASSEKRGAVVYSLDDKNKDNEVKGIKINKDVSSLIFLHAVTDEAINAKAYRKIFNFEDTAELLGWYEIVYEDGFIITVPIRFGINILDWNVHNRLINKVDGKSKYAQNKYAYEAEAISVSGPDVEEPITFFAYEWENQRHGEIIKEVNLKAVTYKKKHDNAIILIALSAVDINVAVEAKGEESE